MAFAKLSLFSRQFAVQRRVVGALFMREFVTRWGRQDFGFAWLFAEPLVFAFPVLYMWSQIRAPVEHGLPMLAFVWTGYLPLLIFRHVTGHALNVVSQSATLLYHSQVTPLDIFIGRQGLEVIGNMAAVAASFLVFYIIGWIDLPEDYGIFLVGFFYMSWWSLAVALNLAALSERSEMVAHIWAPISYMYMAVCGFMFLAEWLPTPLRNVAMTIDPPLHAYEMIRSGLFGNRIHAYYDIPYLSYILATMTVIGLWQMRQVRRHIVIG